MLAMTLSDLAQKHGTDKFEHGYCPHYEVHLNELWLTKQPMSLLEIGIFHGDSLRMWQEWLPKADIYGIDIDPVYVAEVGPGISAAVYDAKCTEPWPFLVHEFDVIIDDGSHLAQDILAAVRHLWEKVKPGGWYIIEDWAVAWLPEWGGSPSGTIALDEMHRALDSCLRNEGVREFHAYEQIIFMRKEL